MKTATTPPMAVSVAAVVPPEAGAGVAKTIGLIAALVALLVIVLMPTPGKLSQAGQVMLGMLAFARAGCGPEQTTPKVGLRTRFPLWPVVTTPARSQHTRSAAATLEWSM